MPWKTNRDLPKQVQILPAAAQSIFRQAANSVLDDGGDEEKAMKIGWGAVKNAGYQKNKDGDWIKKESISSLSENVNRIIEATFTSGSELSINKDNRTVKLNIIQTGKSLNGNKWERKHLEQLFSLLENNQGRKQYTDHKDHSKYGRSVLDWTATLSNPEIIDKDGKSILRAETTVFEYPDAAKAIWERIEKCPEEIGVSIDAFVTGKYNKDENGLTCFIPEDVIKLNSADFVTEASAGGGVLVSESVGKIHFGDVATKEGTLSNIVFAENISRAVMKLLYAFEGICQSIFYDNELDGMSKKELILSFIDELKLEISKMPFSEDNDFVEGIANNKETVAEIKTVDDLTKSYPDIVSILKSSIIENFKNQIDNLDKENKFNETINENKILKEKITQLDSTNSELNAKLESIGKELDAFNITKNANLKKEAIDLAIKDSKICIEAVTDGFRDMLFSIEDGTNFIDKIKVLIEDRKNVWNKALLLNHGVKNFGPSHLKKEDALNNKSLDDRFKEMYPNLLNV